MTSRLPRYEAKCVQRRCFQCGSVPLLSDIKGRSYPLPIYWYHSKGNWLRYNFAADGYYIMRLCSRLFVLYCRSCPNATNLGTLSPFWGSWGGVEPWSMALWKARVRLLIRHNWTFFASSYRWGVQRKMCQDSLLSGGGTSVWAKISGEGVVPGEYFWFVQN